MKKIIPLLILIFTLIIFTGCQKNVDFVETTSVQGGPDTVWRNNITPDMPVASLKNDLALPRQQDSVLYNATGFAFTNNNLILNVPAAGLSSNGINLQGNVIRRSLLVLKKGDYIANNIPTQNGGRLIIAGGAFFNALKINDNDVSVAQNKKLGVRFNSNNIQQGLSIFSGIDDLNAGFNWLPENDTALNKVSTLNNGYEIQTNKLRFVLAGKFLDTTGVAQTSFSVSLPFNYTNTNTITFITFNDMPIVAAMQTNVLLRKFISPNLPLNRAVKIIVLSKQAGDYYLGFKQTTTGGSILGTPATLHEIVPTKKSLAEIKSFLDLL